MRRPKDYRPDQGARFEVHFEKSRGIYGYDVKPFEALLTTSPDRRQVWTLKDLEDSLFDRLVDLLNDGYNQKDAAEALGKTKGYISKLTRKAREMGLLDNNGEK